MTEQSDSYRSIASPSTGSYRDLGSRFLAFAYPVETLEEVKERLNEIKKEYFDATHHCYAYRLGHLGDVWRANDDGEPSFTAGKPIHGQLLSNALSDVLIVVVRYFGGTKLGVPGLIKAYRTAAQEAIANARFVEKTATRRFSVEFDYLQMNSVMKILKEMGISPASQQFDSTCRMEVKVRLSRIEDFQTSISDFASVNPID